MLLFRHRRRNGTMFWALPGGGVEAGEHFEQAALREAEEELGLSRSPVKFLWERTSDFEYINGPVHQHEHFFLVRGPLLPFSGEVQKTHLREGILEMRWWTTTAIELSNEPIFPEGIASELKNVFNTLP